jgi:predicted transcriptional regulator
MNTHIDFQTIQDANGNPVFAVVPYADFIALYAKENGIIPHAVISATVDGNSPIKAWREYLGFSPAEIAARLDMSQAEFAEIETAVKPRQVILKKVAQALGLTVAQLDF